MEGTFQYSSPQGRATLAPGAVLLGNEGTCFECGHEHGVGDRCLSFHYEPAYFEDVLASIGGTRRLGFEVPRLPPSSAITPYVAAAESVRTDPDTSEEIALGIAGAVVSILAEGRSGPSTTSDRDERRITEIVRFIEANPQERLELVDLARAAAMSPFHFLRVFRSVVGNTPRQFVLATRLRRAAVKLRRTDDAVSNIAYEAGFKDLSEFNRRFIRFVGVTPGAYRARPRGGLS
jgi:AraC-like DNA-binding protein